MSQLKKLYQSYNFPGKAKFRAILLNHGIEITSKELTEFYSNQLDNQLHYKERAKPELQYFIAASRPGEVVQMDLIDYSKYSRRNGGYKWILIMVDVFSRVVLCQPMKNKTPTSTLAAFEASKMPLPERIDTDDGNEFRGVFAKYMEKSKVIHVVYPAEKHATAVADAACKTIKTAIEKHMELANNNRWIDLLQNVVAAYNKTPHSSLADYSPREVIEDDDADFTVNQIYQAKMDYNRLVSEEKDRARKIFTAGDIVRKKLPKQTFKKGYKALWSYNTFRVVEELDGNKYKLDDKSIVAGNNLIISKIENDMPSFVKLEDRDAVIRRRLQRENL